MNQENHFLPQEKLLKTTGKKMDFEVVKNIQGFTEKVTTDIINRSALLVRHKGEETIDVNEICMVIEKDFDYSFGTRTILNKKSAPTSEHIERMAELSRQK